MQSVPIMKRREFLARMGEVAGTLTALGLTGCAAPSGSRRARPVRKPEKFFQLCLIRVLNMC